MAILPKASILLQTQCNPYWNSNIILHRNIEKILKFIWSQRPQKAKVILSKKGRAGSIISDFKLHCRVIV
jgi:hypothetical protein